MTETFADEIGRRRIRLGRTQRAMSRSLGLGPTTWESWERGVHQPSVLTQRAVLAELRDLEAQLVDEILEEHG